MKMNVTVMTLCESALMTPIRYKMRAREMMATVTAVVHPIEVLLEVGVVVVW